MAAPTLSASQAARHDQPAGVGHPFGQPPVEELARAGVGPVDQQELGPVLLEAPDVAVPGREGLDGPPTRLADPLGVLDRLEAVQLDGVQPDLVDDLDDPLGRLVPEHADRHRLVRQALDDVGHRAGRHLAGRRGEDEADRRGTHAHGQQGVGLGGDAADLHEHAVGLLADAVAGGHVTRLRGARPPAAAGPASGPASPPPARRGSRPSASRRTSSASADARLGHGHHPGRDDVAEGQRPPAVDLEGAQVALVDPDQSRPRRRGPGRARRPSCTSTRAASEQPAARGRGTIDSSSSLRAATMSSTASAPMSRASHTSRAPTREVLAQHREGTGRPGGCAGRRRQPPKNSRVGEHREAGRPAGLVLLGHRRPGRGRGRGRPWTATGA